MRWSVWLTAAGFQTTKQQSPVGVIQFESVLRHPAIKMPDTPKEERSPTIGDLHVRRVETGELKGSDPRQDGA